MRPLLFLFGRAFWNGVKRSASSPQRAISLVLALAYYYFLLVRSFLPTPSPAALPLAHPLALPDFTVLRGVIFWMFSIATLMMAAGMFSARGGFRPADVDVLFATPVKPAYVLVFRMVRDYVFTLIAPLFFALLGWRGTSVGIGILFRNYPAHSIDVLRGAWIAWMLLSLAFVSMGYGGSLFIGRSDLKSDLNQRRINYFLNGVVLTTLGYVAYHLHRNLTFDTFIGLSHSIFVEAVFLPATLATNLVVGALQGNWLLVSIASGGLICTIVLGITLAMTQVGWLYDQAAAKGFGAAKAHTMRRTGDAYGLAAERARTGKKARHVISKSIAQLTLTKSGALIWKEQLLQLRGPMSGVLIIFCGLLIAYGAVGYVSLSESPAQRSSGVLEIILPCFSAYILGAINGFQGFQEMLRRVDLLKPLPFSCARLVLAEVLAKAPIPIFMLSGSGLLLCVINPAQTSEDLAGLVLGCSLLLEITGSILLAVVLFPDLQDATQRGLGGVVMMLTIVICSSPGLGLFVVLKTFLGWASLTASVPSALVLVSITLGLSAVAGTIYSRYNPSE